MKSLFYTVLVIAMAFTAICSSRLPEERFLKTSYNPTKKKKAATQSTAALPFQPPTPLPVPVKQDIPLPLPFAKPVPNLSSPLIVIDPGHGGKDFGTHSLTTPKYQEKYLNLSTANIVKNFLEQFGYRVVMTRYDDTFISLEDRALFANNLNPALFVSIHYNSAPSREAEGIEIFYYRSADNKLRSNKSKLLAQSILEKAIQHTKAKSRGVKHGNLSVIRQTKMTAVLIEGGFLTCANEMDKIKTGPYQKSLALGIARGIQDYLAKEGLFNH